MNHTNTVLSAIAIPALSIAAVLISGGAIRAQLESHGPRRPEPTTSAFHDAVIVRDDVPLRNPAPDTGAPPPPSQTGTATTSPETRPPQSPADHFAARPTNGTATPEVQPEHEHLPANLIPDNVDRLLLDETARPKTLENAIEKLQRKMKKFQAKLDTASSDTESQAPDGGTTERARHVRNAQSAIDALQKTINALQAKLDAPQTTTAQ